jgi:hypothetical protein
VSERHQALLVHLTFTALPVSWSSWSRGGQVSLLVLHLFRWATSSSYMNSDS